MALCCCSSGSTVEHAPTPSQAAVKKRRIRDPIPALVFIIFVGGMIAIGVAAFVLGDPNRIKHGIDSFGNVCGSVNTWNGTTGPDLTTRPHLYLMDPLSITSLDALWGAKSVCVASCPTACSSIPCDLGDDANYICPYYRASGGLYSSLQPTPDDWDTTYITALSTTTASNCTAAGLRGAQTGPSWQLLSQQLLGSNTPASCGQALQVQSAVPSMGPCYPVMVETREYANRCFPDAQQLVAQFRNVTNTQQLARMVGYWASSRARLQSYLNDIDNGKLVVLGIGIGGAVVLSFFYCILLQLVVGFITWLTLLLVNLALIACTLLCFQKAGMLATAGTVGAQLSSVLTAVQWDPSSTDRQYWQITAWVMVGVAAAGLLLTVLLAPKIKVAIAALKMGSRALCKMPGLLCIPLITVLLTGGFLVWWVFVIVYLYTAGDIVPVIQTPNGTSTVISTPPPIDWNQVYGLPVAALPTPTTAATSTDTAAGTAARCAADPYCSYQVQWNAILQGMFVVHIFGLLWISAFIKAFGIVSISNAVSSLYWTKRDSSTGVPRCAALHAAVVALVYYTGSMALGSFLQALLGMLQYLFGFLHARTQRAQRANRVVACLAKGVMALLCVLRTILSWISRNAYVMVASNGTGYCTSAARATALMLSNVVQVATVHWIAAMIMWLAKVGIAAGCAAAAMVVFDLSYFRDPVRYPGTAVSSPLVPVLITALLAYIIADKVLQVWETAVDTMLLCYCEDCESNAGHPKEAHPHLAAALHKAGHDKHQAGDSMPVTVLQVQASTPGRGGVVVVPATQFIAQ